jgi:putative flippase GtrA
LSASRQAGPGAAASQQFLRFAVVGVLAVAMHYSVMAVLVESGLVGAVVATTVGFFCGAALSYHLNQKHTFRTGRPSLSEFAKYLLFCSAGALLNAGIVWLAVRNGVHYTVAQLGATGIVLFWNFFSTRHFVFRAKGKE